MGWFCFCQDPKHTKTIGYTWYKDQFHYIFMCEEEFSCIFPHTSSKIVYWHIDVAVGPECETLPSCPIRGYSIPTWFQSFWIYCRGSAMRCEIFNRDQQSPPARSPCSWDNQPTWSSDSWFRSWFVFPELLVQDCLLALKVCPVVSIVRLLCNARCLDGAFLRCCCCLASRVPLPDNTPKKEILQLVCV